MPDIPNMFWGLTVEAGKMRVTPLGSSAFRKNSIFIKDRNIREYQPLNDMEKRDLWK